MKITTNYSKHDWHKAIPYIIVQLIPVIFLFSTVFWLYVPFLENWAVWMNFNTDINSVGEFAEYIAKNQLMNSPDEFVMFMFVVLFGSAFFPILIIYRVYNIIPTKTICKKLKIEPMMKLVIFKDGKPIRKVRDLFE